jgi:hypothetical protein
VNCFAAALDLCDLHELCHSPLIFDTAEVRSSILHVPIMSLSFNGIVL